MKYKEYSNIRDFECTRPFRIKKNFFENFSRLLKIVISNNGLTCLQSLDNLQSFDTLVINDNKIKEGVGLT